MNPEVIVIGAGLAGLSCTRRLQEKGVSSLLLEASDAVGGRVRTDSHQGFLLDRGFQVFSTAYPEANKALDYDALQLSAFYPGALVYTQGSFHRFADPWRRPFAGLRSLFSPVGTLRDKLRIARLRKQSRTGTLDDLFQRPEKTTLQALQNLGFSDSMIDQFFRPFLGGIFLENELRTSSRMLEFVFRMFAEGDATLPQRGMQAIPEQLRSHLSEETVRLRSPVTALRPGEVELSDGEVMQARAVVVAVEGPEAARLLEQPMESRSRGVTCLYFATTRSPVTEPILVLNGSGQGRINNVCVPSSVHSEYSPPGADLVSVSVLGIPELDDVQLVSEVKSEMTQWYGVAVQDWEHLKTYRIAQAQPEQAPPALSPSQRPVQLSQGLFVCGDHRDNASINGAIQSGHRIAEAVISQL